MLLILKFMLNLLLLLSLLFILLHVCFWLLEIMLLLLRLWQPCVQFCKKFIILCLRRLMLHHCLLLWLLVLNQTVILQHQNVVFVIYMRVLVLFEIWKWIVLVVVLMIKHVLVRLRKVTLSCDSLVLGLRLLILLLFFLLIVGDIFQRVLLLKECQLLV